MPGNCKTSLTIAHVHAADIGGGAEGIARSLHLIYQKMGHRSYLFVGRKEGADTNVFEIPRHRGVPGSQRVARWLERHFGLQYLYSPGFRRLHQILPDSVDLLHIHSLHGADGYADIGALPFLASRYPTLLWLNDMWLLTGHCAHSLQCERWKTGCGNCQDLGMFPPINKDGSRVNWLRKKRIMDRSNCNVAGPSQWIVDQAAQSPILNKFPRCVIPNGIDLSLFQPAEKQAAKAALNILPDNLIVLLAAQFIDHPCKGTRDAIDAINNIQHNKLTVVLVGCDSDKVAVQLRQPTRVFPYVTDQQTIAACYQAADVLLMPSLGEIFGLTAAEAMACGTPVVAYATGGLPEVIGDEGAGVLVKRGDVLGLTTALRDLLDDGERREKMGYKSAQRAARLFDIRKQAERLIDLYRRMIAQQGKTSTLSPSNFKT